MSSLADADVVRLARLANLIIEEEEIKSLKRELSEVVSYFGQLQELQTNEIEPTSQTTGLQDVLRADEINSSIILPVSGATSGTDQIHNDMFVVSQVIDKNQQ